MTREESKNLNHGLYLVKWKKRNGGGTSLASIGSSSNGDRWIAPCNWVSGSSDDPGIWDKIKKVKIIRINK